MAASVWESTISRRRETDLSSGRAEWEQFVERLDSAQQAFVAGDSEPFKELWLKTDEASIFGGFGGRTEGWSELEGRLQWAAAQFAAHFVGVAWRWELIRESLEHPTAYTVHLETTEPTDPAMGRGRQELRVTQIYRHVEGRWRIVHRHADTLIASAPPNPGLAEKARPE